MWVCIISVVFAIFALPSGAQNPRDKNSFTDRFGNTISNGGVMTFATTSNTQPLMYYSNVRQFHPGSLSMLYTFSDLFAQILALSPDYSEYPTQ